MRNGKKSSICISVFVLVIFSISILTNQFNSQANIENNSSIEESLEILPATETKENCRLVGQWDSNIGNPNSIVVENNLAYLTCGSGGLHIYDVSNLENPIFISSYESGVEYNDLEIINDLAYICCVNQLLILNISNPEDIIYVGHLAFYGVNGQAIEVAGNYAYLGLMFGSFLIVDISNPATPVAIEYYSGVDTIFLNVRVFGNYAFLCYLESGLEIVNITDPYNPIFVAHFMPTDTIHDFIMIGEYGYLTGVSYGVYTVNLTDIINPEFVSDQHIFAYYPTALYHEGDRLYVVDQSIVRLINITNITAPKELSNFNCVDTTECLFANNSILFTCGYGLGLTIYDASVYYDVSLLTTLSSGGDALDICLMGNYVLLANDWDGMAIIDISTPEAPVEIASYKRSSYNYIQNIVQKDNYAFISDSRDLVVIDLTVIYNPTLSQEFINIGYCMDLTIKDNYLYYAFESGMYIFDVSNPSNITCIGELDIGDEVNCIYVLDQTAFICGSFPGVAIVDLSNITNPEITYTFATWSSYNFKVAVFDNLALLVTGTNGLFVYDVSNFDDVKSLGSFTISGYIGGLFIQGDWVYVGTSNTGMEVFNIHNPASPREIGYYYNGQIANTIIADKNTFYVANRFGGLLIVELDMTDSDDDYLPDELEVNPYETDPFNPDTDGDGYLDGIEVFMGTDPNNRKDHPTTSRTISLNFLVPIALLSITGIYCVIVVIETKKRKL